MNAQHLLFERRLTAVRLIFCGIVFMVASYLFFARAIWKLPAAQTDLQLCWERGLIITAFLINVMGFVLLEGLLREGGDRIIARLALASYLIAGAVLVVAEMAYLNREWVYPQIVAHVVLAFLAQVAFGAALLRTGLVASCAGWATIHWNIGGLVVMPITYPHDMYFPWLYYVAPLMIGIALLAGEDLRMINFKEIKYGFHTIENIEKVG